MQITQQVKLTVIYFSLPNMKKATAKPLRLMKDLLDMKIALLI